MAICDKEQERFVERAEGYRSGAAYGSDGTIGDACVFRRYENDVDEALEDAYQSYLKRKGKREELEAAKEEAAVAKRARLGKGGDLGGGDGDASGDEAAAEASATFGTAPASMEEDEEVLLISRALSRSVKHPGAEPLCDPQRTLANLGI